MYVPAILGRSCVMDQKPNSVCLATADRVGLSASRGATGQNTQQDGTRTIRHVRQYAAIVGEISSMLCIAGMFFSGGCGREGSASPTVLSTKQDAGPKGGVAGAGFGESGVPTALRFTRQGRRPDLHQDRLSNRKPLCPGNPAAQHEVCSTRRFVPPRVPRSK